MEQEEKRPLWPRECFATGKKIGSDHGADHHSNPNGAVSFRSSGNYGSRVLDSMGLTEIEIVISDEFIAQHAHRAIIYDTQDSVGPGSVHKVVNDLLLARRRGDDLEPILDRLENVVRLKQDRAKEEPVWDWFDKTQDFPLKRKFPFMTDEAVERMKERFASRNREEEMKRIQEDFDARRKENIEGPNEYEPGTRDWVMREVERLFPDGGWMMNDFVDEDGEHKFVIFTSMEYEEIEGGVAIRNTGPVVGSSWPDAFEKLQQSLKV